MGRPYILCDTAGMDRAEWLKCRAHGPDGSIPVTIGGSDVSVILGVNPWKTPLQLWEEKCGFIEPDDSANAHQKEMGRMMEPIIAHFYGVVTGNTVIEDTNFYQHADYSFAIADIDYRFLQPDGLHGILDCKHTSYRKMGAWADKAIPYMYELQLRHYMGVLDMDFSDACALWGNNPLTDMATPRISRDRAKEQMIFEAEARFVECVNTKTPPDMKNVDPQLAYEALMNAYARRKAKLPELVLDPHYTDNLQRIIALQAENKKLDNQKKGNQKEIQELSVEILTAMQEYERAVLPLPQGHILVDYITKSRRDIDRNKLKEEFAEVYKAVQTTNYSRSLSIKAVEDQVPAAA